MGGRCCAQNPAGQRRGSDGAATGIDGASTCTDAAATGRDGAGTEQGRCSDGAPTEQGRGSDGRGRRRGRAHPACAPGHHPAHGGVFFGLRVVGGEQERGKPPGLPAVAVPRADGHEVEGLGHVLGARRGGHGGHGQAAGGGFGWVWVSVCSPPGPLTDLAVVLLELDPRGAALARLVWRRQPLQHQPAGAARMIYTVAPQAACGGCGCGASDRQMGGRAARGARTLRSRPRRSGGGGP